MYLSPAQLTQRSRIGLLVLVPAAALVMIVQALRVLPVTTDRPNLTMMVFLSLLSGALLSGWGYIAGRCMLCAADAFGAGYRLRASQQEASQQEPVRLTVVE